MQPQGGKRPVSALLGGPVGAPGSAAPVAEVPERHFPISVVLAHGLFAVTTVVLVLISALQAHG